jgi:aspartate 1-decarboxylase
MQRHMAKSKLHGAIVTDAVLYYEGSITIDRELMDAADLVPFERVQIVNVNNGSRIETYVIEGDRGGGTICLNGPAARYAVVGDKVHIISYALYEDAEARTLDMKNVKVDGCNKILSVV